MAGNILTRSMVFEPKVIQEDNSTLLEVYLNPIEVLW